MADPIYPVAVQPMAISDIIVWEEGGGRYSRSVVTIESGTVVKLGNILEPSGAANTYELLDGTGEPSAIALQDVDASGGAKDIVALTGHAVVRGNYLGYNSQTVATVNAALETNAQIKVRFSV